MALMLPLTAGLYQCRPKPGSVHLCDQARVQLTHSLQADSGTPLIQKINLVSTVYKGMKQ